MLFRQQRLWVRSKVQVTLFSEVILDDSPFLFRYTGWYKRWWVGNDESMKTKIENFELNDGTSLSAIGFGTVNIQGAKWVNSVLTAIDAGYRLIDASTNYMNEGMVGEAIRRSSVPREELMINSKLPGKAHE